MSLELLDTIHAKGLVAAQAHFEALVAVMNSVLPDGVKDTIPKTLDEVAGLFSASTKEFYLIILANTPGYESMNVVFKYAITRAPLADYGLPGWCFKKFSVMIGSTSMFSAPKEYTATCIEDALVLSKRIAKYREQYVADNIPMPETATTTRPN